MENVQLFVIARAIHIAGIVFWIGGVAFVTLVLLPSLKSRQENKVHLFEELEGRFASIAKWSVLLVGLSGLYMLYFLNGWSRYQSLDFWWMHLMTFVWFVFAIVLYILEPFFLHEYFHIKAIKNPDHFINSALILHRFLLILSLCAIIGAMLGAHGYSF